MSDCDIREDLVAYLDGELDPDDAARVERSVREDPALELELRSLRETGELLDLYPPPARVRDLAPAVVRRVVRRRRLVRLVPALALAASLLLLAGILGLLRSSGEPVDRPQHETIVDSETAVVLHLHALEYMALEEEAGEDIDALLEDADFILALIEEEVEER